LFSKKGDLEVKKIETLFDNSAGKSILFLGKFGAFTDEELEIFLDKFDIGYTNRLGDNIAMVIEGSILSPLEDQIAQSAYTQKIPFFRSEQFEELYAANLNSDSILMSLKLSNNQERLRRLLKNRYISDELFLKLFKLHDWIGEGLFDTSENMEVTTLFAKRFYTKDRFDKATFHSPISIFETALLNDNPDVLEILFSLPELSINQSRSTIKRPTSIKEALSTNPHINATTIKKLIRRCTPEIDYFLAQNSALNDQQFTMLYERADASIKCALATNSNLPVAITEKLLNEDQKIAERALLYQPIQYETFKKLPTLFPILGANESLENRIIEELIKTEQQELLKNLSQNASLNQHALQQLYEKHDHTLYPYLASNPNLPQELLRALYQQQDHRIDIALATNSATPTALLDALYQKDDFPINQALASNSSVPIEHLHQLKLDRRLLDILKENKTFTDNILNTLGI
jgi:uncharacterized protein YneF (UPF0154 family)